MKKMRKVLGALLVCFMVLSSGVFSGKVWATTIGSKLLNPEAGWQRIDDSDTNFTYVGSWTTMPKGSALQNLYNNTAHQTRIVEDCVKFNIVSSSLRILNTYDSAGNAGGVYNVNIDGKDCGDYTVLNRTNLNKCILVFEKLNLSNTEHSVIITVKNLYGAKDGSQFDCIDISDSGTIKPYNENNVQDIALNPTSLNLKIGQTDTVTATVYPENATNKAVNWTSSDNSIATVDSTGIVTAKGTGTAIITATTVDGNKTATCTVNVTDKNPTLNIVASKKKVKVGEEFTTDAVFQNVSNIYAEDFKVNYDSTKFTYEGFDQVAGYKVYNTPTDNNGTLRFVVASQGQSNVINGDKVVLKLKFKAKAVGVGKVDALKARIADTDKEYDIDDANCLEDSITVEGAQDVNRTGEYTLLDLAIDGYYYGLNASATNTAKYDADQGGSTAIDDTDLTYIVQQMLDNTNYAPNK